MEALMQRYLERSDSLLECMVARNVGKTCYSTFAHAADMLGMDQEAVRLKRIVARFTQLQTAAKSMPANALFDRHGNEYTQLYGGLASVTARPPEVTLEDLLPGSYHNHALASRALAIAACAVFGITIGLMALGRLTVSKLVRILSARMIALLGPADHLWITALGLVIPVLFMVVLARLTPLGGREFSVEQGTKWILPAAHFLGVALLIPAASVLSARWRLRKRAGIFGLGSQRPWAAGTAVLFTAAGMVLAGCLVIRQQWTPATQYLAAAPFAIALLLLLSILVQGVFGTMRHRLDALTVAGIVTPVLGCAMLLMIAFTPLLKEEEHYWFDRFSFIQPVFDSSPQMNYESKLIAAIRQELLAALEEQ